MDWMGRGERNFFRKEKETTEKKNSNNDNGTYEQTNKRAKWNGTKLYQVLDSLECLQAPISSAPGKNEPRINEWGAHRHHFLAANVWWTQFGWSALLSCTHSGKVKLRVVCSAPCVLSYAHATLIANIQFASFTFHSEFPKCWNIYANFHWERTCAATTITAAPSPSRTWENMSRMCTPLYNAPTIQLCRCMTIEIGVWKVDSFHICKPCSSS